MLSKAKVVVVTKVQRDYETTVTPSSLPMTKHYSVFSPPCYRKEEELAEEDKWLLEVNLGGLPETSGEEQEYWLLAVKAVLASRTLGTDGRRRCEREHG